MILPTINIKDLHNRRATNSVRELQEDLSALSEHFQKISFPLYLVGGIGLAVRNSEFYRHHKDFDLAVFEHDLESLDAYLQETGYELVHRFFSANISPWHNLQLVRKTNVQEYRSGNYKRTVLRIRKKGGRMFRYFRRRSSYLDLFLLQHREEGVYLVGDDVLVDWDDFLPEQNLSDDSRILLPNIRYKQYLHPVKQKEVMDFEMNGLQLHTEINS